MRKANWRISRCCTVRNCCTALVLPKSEQRSCSRLRRVHGLQFPLHPQQVVGWIALFGIAFGTFMVVLPYLGPNFQPLASALIGVTFSLHVAAHLVALLLDPADPKVREQSSKKIVPEFDRTKHLHVIENGRCHLCNINTTNKRTKHCSICNKCIEKFDHHCKWLNNCIGGRNYTAFIVCVVSAVISTLVVAGLSVTEIAIVNLDSSILNNWQVNIMDNVTLPIAQSPPGTGSLIVISLVGILSAIAAVLLIHLCFFHGYIACLGLTTYEYVRNKRERKIAKGDVLEGERNISEALMRSCPSSSSFLCNDNTDDGKRMRYNQSNDKSLSTNEYNNETCSRESSVYICSTHQRQSCVDDNGGGRIKDRRNFHLYFSYETRDSETSIEVSSQTIVNDDIDRRQESIEFKPSTPSPVSCCFSIINAKSTSKHKEGNNDQRKSTAVGTTTATSGSKDQRGGARSCLTMRRIQSFLRTRLRRNSRQRSLNGCSDGSRSRKNKVNPSTTTSADNISDLEKDTEINKSPTSSTSCRDADNLQSTQFKPPVKLPPLVLPPRHRMKQIPSTIDGPITNPIAAITMQKRCQPPLRIRRTSFYKRPRFKMGPHVTETAQLSPIPESEFSKPASPRTPPQINHFPFPPPLTNGMKSNDVNPPAADH